MFKGKVLIGQSGGPTSVINSSLAGIIDGCARVAEITGVLGMRWGIEGFMAGNLVDLAAQGKKIVAALRRTPSAALGSSRHKVKEPDFPVILQRLKEFDIRYLFMIGGNDTMDTLHRVTEHAAGQGYDMCGIGVPKTVDNDLFCTDHTPGFASAARYVALSVQQTGILARDMQKVDQFMIYQSIGRDAGWLSAAAALAKRDEADAPHIICMPERSSIARSFSLTYRRHTRVSVSSPSFVARASGMPTRHWFRPRGRGISSPTWNTARWADRASRSSFIG